MSKALATALSCVFCVGCNAGDLTQNTLATSGTWTVYEDPYGNGDANPAQDIDGQASALKAGDGRMLVTLDVWGLMKDREYGAHLHKLGCDDMQAGGHYQNASGGTADSQNEVWLDLKTDQAGMAIVEATVDWLPRSGEAKAIVVHDHRTEAGGKAGPKLACLSLVFD